MLSRKKDFIKSTIFRFSSFNGTLVRFSIKIDDFGFDIHDISFSVTVEANQCYGYTETTLLKELLFSDLARITSAVELGMIEQYLCQLTITLKEAHTSELFTMILCSPNFSVR